MSEPLADGDARRALKDLPELGLLLSFGAGAAALRFVHAARVDGDAEDPDAGPERDVPEVAVARLGPDDLCALARMHARLAAALGFPSYYGANWDALFDVLTDDAVLGDRRAFLMILDDGEEAFARAPHVVGALIEIALDAERAWRARGLTDVVQVVVLWRRTEPRGDGRIALEGTDATG